MLAAEGVPAVMGRTTDIGPSGVSINVPNPVPVGEAVQVRFDLLVEGTSVCVNTRARTQYCVLSGGDFKVGLQFLALDPAVSGALARFLR